MWMLAFALSPAGPALAELVTFQQGTNGYDRAQDTAIRWAYTTNFGDTADLDYDHPGDTSSYEMYSTNGGASTVLEAGHFFQRLTGTIAGGGTQTLEAGPAYRYARFFIRFRDVFGTSPSQVPLQPQSGPSPGQSSSSPGQASPAPVQEFRNSVLEQFSNSVSA